MKPAPLRHVEINGAKCGFYAKKYAEATKHAHRRALVLTARKLTRLVFALLRDDRARTTRSTYRCSLARPSPRGAVPR